MSEEQPQEQNATTEDEQQLKVENEEQVNNEDEEISINIPGDDTDEVAIIAEENEETVEDETKENGEHVEGEPTEKTENDGASSVNEEQAKDIDDETVVTGEELKGDEEEIAKIDQEEEVLNENEEQKEGESMVECAADGEATEEKDLNVHKANSKPETELSKDDQEEELDKKKQGILNAVEFESDDDDVDLDVFSEEKSRTEELVEAESVSESSSEEEKALPIDRESYIKEHERITAEMISIKLKNNYLHKKLSEYFKKRKMEHVLRDTTEGTFDTQTKYGKILDALTNLLENDEKMKGTVTEELNHLKEIVRVQEDNFIKTFEEMQRYSMTIGTGLIFKKTAKEIPEKLVDRFIMRQSLKNNEICSMRLAYLKVRDRVQETDAALHELDKLGPNLFLGEYERLKSENQNRRDKIEEKDAELSRLRLKCQGAIQILAHIREKSFSAASDLTDNEQKLRDVELEVLECRERVNYYKQIRDGYRLEREVLQKESGLLTRPTLLQDMELVVERLMNAKDEMVRLIEKNSELQRKLDAANNNLANLHLWMPTQQNVAEEEKRGEGKICKGRPNIFYHKIPDSTTFVSESGTSLGTGTGC